MSTPWLHNKDIEMYKGIQTFEKLLYLLWALKLDQKSSYEGYAVRQYILRRRHE